MKGILSKIKNALQSSAAQKTGTGAPAEKKISASVTANVASLFALFLFIVISYMVIKKTGDPGKYLTSPITILTMLMIFAILMGYIRISPAMIGILGLLLILTIYQGDIDSLLEDFKDDMKIIKDKTGGYKPQPDVTKEVLRIFNQKYASKDNDKVKITIARIDQGKLNVPFFSWERFKYEYFMIITPEVKTIRTKKFADTSNEEITMYLKDHIAEVPIVYDGNLYWVETTAYVMRVPDPWLYPGFALFNSDNSLELVTFMRNAPLGKMKTITITKAFYNDIIELAQKDALNLDDVIYQNIEWI